MASRNKRKTINYGDIVAAVKAHQEFEFLEGTIRPGVGESKVRAPKREAGEVAQPVEGTTPDEIVEPDPKQMKMDQMFSAAKDAGEAPMEDGGESAEVAHETGPAEVASEAVEQPR